MNAPVYISNGGDALGPYEKSQLLAMWSTGQITANTLYWDEERQEWRGISELGLGDSTATAPQEKPKGKFLDGVSSSSKHTSPVRYWALRGGGLGLAGGFLSGIAGYGAPPAVALGMGIPMALLFAGVGAIIGLAIKMTRREAKK
jgi:hypothetical protein